MSKKLFLSLMLCLSLLALVSPSLAQVDQKSGEDTLAKLQREGWKILNEGVLQRELRPGKLESFVFGVPGFTWKIQYLRRRLHKLRAEFRARPTPELRRAIASHRKVIASTQEMIERARAAEASGETAVLKTGCTPTFTYIAKASYKTDRQGVWADASADFNLPAGCAGSGEVYAYAFAKTTVNGAPTTATVTDGPRSGANVSAAADANRNGGVPCESYAYASITSNNLNPASYSMSSTNTSCPPPPPPLSVSITSDQPASFSLSKGSCRTITWTVNISGGTPGYSSAIYLDDFFQLSGTSYSLQVCGTGSGKSQLITVRADVSDSGGQSKSASQAITITHLYSGTDLCKSTKESPYCE